MKCPAKNARGECRLDRGHDGHCLVLGTLPSYPSIRLDVGYNLRHGDVNRHGGVYDFPTNTWIGGAL